MKIQGKYRKAVDKFVKMSMDKCGDKLEEIILFGSVVRGEANEDSDIDILVITKEDSFKMQKLLSEIVIDVLLTTGIYLSLKVLSPEEYNHLKKINSSFYRNVSREGISIG